MRSHVVLCGSRLGFKVRKLAGYLLISSVKISIQLELNINAHGLLRVVLASVDFILCGYLILFSANLPVSSALIGNKQHDMRPANVNYILIKK